MTTGAPRAGRRASLRPSAREALPPGRAFGPWPRCWAVAADGIESPWPRLIEKLLLLSGTVAMLLWRRLVKAGFVGLNHCSGAA